MQVSIIIPAYNEGQYLQALLESINEHVDVPMEIIVVDNGSTDNTLDIAEKFNCIVVSMGKKYFPSIVRNAGVLQSTGECLVFLDADIVITKQWADELKLLIENPETLTKKFVTGASCHVSQNPSWIEQYWFEPLSKKKKQYINGANIITITNVFHNINGFDELLETGEDVDFCIRAEQAGATIVLNDNWKVYHEGFPRTLKAFVRRESWHGKGDLLDFERFISSKVAIASAVFVLLHFILLSSNLFSRTNEINMIAISLIILLCYARAKKDMAMNNLKQIIYTTFISYLYFLGRSLSFISIFKS